MSNQSIKEIENIIQNLDFVGQDQLRVKGGKMVYQINQGSEAEKVELLKGLSNVIYSEFYCAVETELNEEPSFDARVAFVQQLRAANNTEEKLDKGWMAKEVMQNGIIYAEKGFYQQQARPGEYVLRSKSENPSEGGEICIYQYGEYDQKEDAFYYIMGETLTEENAGGLVRFYFNVKPEGALELVKNISHYFNQYQIPFQFKCLNQPAYYNRTDTAVLYMGKSHADFAAQIITLFYKELQPWLNPALPYFTKELAPGIGFAENPGKEKESFGQSRSRLIAAAILKAQEQNIPKKDWLNVVLELIKKKGFNIDEFHLNPNSHYPYELSTIA